MVDVLKPCPFCGADAAYDDSCTDKTIKCGGECGAEPRYLTFGLDQTKRDAVKAWNTRATKPEVSEGIFHRKLMIDDGRVYWLYPDGSHRALNKADVYVINSLRVHAEFAEVKP